VLPCCYELKTYAAPGEVGGIVIISGTVSTGIVDGTSVLVDGILACVAERGIAGDDIFCSRSGLLVF